MEIKCNLTNVKLLTSRINFKNTEVSNRKQLLFHQCISRSYCASSLKSSALTTMEGSGWGQEAKGIRSSHVARGLDEKECLLSPSQYRFICNL